MLGSIHPLFHTLFLVRYFLDRTLFHLDDQPADRNYKNNIYIVLYDTIEERIITVTTKILEDVIFSISKKRELIWLYQNENSIIFCMILTWR